MQEKAPWASEEPKASKEPPEPFNEYEVDNKNYLLYQLLDLLNRQGGYLATLVTCYMENEPYVEKEFVEIVVKQQIHLLHELFAIVQNKR